MSTPSQQFAFWGARLCAKHQPQRVDTQNRSLVRGRAAAGRDDTAALRGKMSIAGAVNRLLAFFGSFR